ALEPSDDMSLEGVSEIVRLKKAFNIISGAISNADPELITISLMDELNGPIQNAYSQITTFTQNNQLPHLHQANTYFDQLLSIIPRIPNTAQDSKGKSLAELLVQYSKTIDKHVGTLEKRIKDDQVDIEEQKRLIDAANKKLADIETRANTAIENHQVEYNKSDQLRTADFQAKLDKLQTQIDTHATAATAKIDASTQALEAKVTQQLTDLKTVYDESLEELKVKNEQASKLLESTGGKLQTHNYAGFAETEGKSATTLRGWAIALMTLSVVVLVLPPLWELFAEHRAFDWEQLLYRIPTVLLILIPAFYLAREAAGHRKAQLENKRIEMELAALMPYMELLDDEDKVELKKQLLGSYFVGHSKDIHNDAASRDNWIKEVVPTLVEKILDRVMSDRAKVG
ncbi:MAG: hypothetical protein ACK529_05325, partial [Alphaproteobacteria bacterium]